MEDGQLLVPTTCDEKVVTGVELLGAEPEAPDWDSLGLADGGEFVSILVSEQDFSIVKSNSQNLTIRRPVTVKTLVLGTELIDTLVLSLPESKIVIRA